ncbi:MAG: tail tape measure protein [Polymorphobacter sp.]
MDELDTLVVRVRADTAGFARDVGDIRGQLEGPLAGGVDSAGRAIESALARAARTGRIGFEDLRKVALATLGDIASQAVRSNLSGLFGGSGGGGLAASLGSAVAGLLGLPGRATGGPVTGGRAYMVGERGPEMFVPTSSGQVMAAGGGRQAVNVTVNVAAPRDAAPAFMARTGTQVARAVRVALDRAER